MQRSGVIWRGSACSITTVGLGKLSERSFVLQCGTATCHSAQGSMRHMRYVCRLRQQFNEHWPCLVASLAGVVAAPRCSLHLRRLIGHPRRLRTSRRNVACAVSVGPEVASSHQQEAVAHELHRLAREALVDRFKQQGAVAGVLFFSGGGDAYRHDTDHEDIFRQESTFHYLFGVREPGYKAVIDLETGSTTLFAPRLLPEYALWMGQIKTLEEILERHGVDDIAHTDEIAVWFQRKGPVKVYVQKGTNSDSGREVVPANFEGLQEKYSVDEESLHEVIYECRVRKNEEEIKILRYVNRISSDAHISIMRHAKPGMVEYQLESLFAYSCHYHGGCRLLSYTPIAASGPNSAVLHYGHAGAPNERRIEDGDMVLCDMGPELYCYASDITNSFPANGKFTPDQRMIFEAVAAMQTAVLNSMMPGALWADMQELAYRVMCEKLLDGGLLVGDVNAMMAANVGGVFMPHGLGHFMGIDTHDVGGYPTGAQRDARDGYKALRMQRKLEPGFVLTVEPGIYFMEYALQKARENPSLNTFFNWDRIAEFASFGGVRLEDNVLVTDEGIENFTTAPRTVDEVEAIMRGEVADAMALYQRRREIEWDRNNAGKE